VAFLPSVVHNIYMSKNFFRKIGFVNFLTPKKEQLIRFYRDTLGMTEIEPGQKESSNWYGFRTAGSTFAIEPESNHAQYHQADPTKRNAFLQFLLDSETELEQANIYLESKGITLITRSKKADYGTFSNFRDPDGNIVELLVPPRQHPRLGPIIIGTADMERAKRFYTTVFGITIESEESNYVSARGADGTHIELEMDSENRFPKWAERNIGTYKNSEFHVPNMQSFLESVVAQGGSVVSKPVARPWGDIGAEFADPDGNIFLVSQK